jgi:hypothetical protein
MNPKRIVHNALLRRSRSTIAGPDVRLVIHLGMPPRPERGKLAQLSRQPHPPRFNASSIRGFVTLD